MNKFKLTIGLLLIFLLGALAGSYGTQVYFKQRAERFFAKPPQARSTAVMHHMSRELDLSPEQRQRIGVIMDDSEQQIREVRREYGPRIREIRDEREAALKAELTEEQIGRYREMRRQFRKRRGMEHHDHGRHGPGHGPDGRPCPPRGCPGAPAQ